MTSIETKVWKWQKCQKNHILFLVSKKVIFHYFWKWRKILFSTFQDLSIDILHVKIKPFLRILKKMVKKVRFCSFLTHAVGKIWSKLIKCMCNNIFYHVLTFKIHRFQRYRVYFTKAQFFRDTLYINLFIYICKSKAFHNLPIPEVDF